jgi:hypothetical protein
MKPARPLPRLPYVLLIAMSVVSFGGPFLIVGVLWGGKSSRWPPDRPIEWATIGAVFVLFLTLFAACVGIRGWYRPERAPRDETAPGGTDVVSRDANLS